MSINGTYKHAQMSVLQKERKMSIMEVVETLFEFIILVSVVMIVTFMLVLVHPA